MTFEDTAMFDLLISRLSQNYDRCERFNGTWFRYYDAMRDTYKAFGVLPSVSLVRTTLRWGA